MRQRVDDDVVFIRGFEMTQGVVQAREFTKKGAAKYQINGAWYYAGRTKTDGLEVGLAIEFGFEEFGEDQGRGRLKGLSWWKPVTRGQSQASSSGVPQKSPGRATTVSTVTEVDILRSVSNIVGSACHAGTVKTAEELLKWCIAAAAGLRGMNVPQKPELDDVSDDFDDEIPF
jgi:hypothetical protein